MTDTPTDLTKPVRTRSGLEVRILCTDAPGRWPVRGYYLDPVSGEAISTTWKSNGRFGGTSENEFDLVNVPETTKRYVIVSPELSFAVLKASEYDMRDDENILELTYEGDKLTAVKIVEDE